MKRFTNFLTEDVQGIYRICMVGGPGSGKSTYSEIICKKLGVPHLYTGDMMRALSKQDTPTGRIVKKALDNAKYVPTPIVMGEVTKRLKQGDTKKGYVFDGFPRNMEQFKAMEEKNIEIDFWINLQVSEKEVVRRLVARGREGETATVIRGRIKEHEAQTGPMIKHLSDQMINIKAEGSTPQGVANDILKKIQGTA